MCCLLMCRDGSVYVFDDFREAYAWLRHNTHPESKVASWWDYGAYNSSISCVCVPRKPPTVSFRPL